MSTVIGFFTWLIAGLSRKVLFYIVGSILAVIAFLLSIWAYTEILWYRAIGYFDVLFTMYTTMFWMGMFPFLTMTLFVVANMSLARILAPADRVISDDERTVDRWRRAITPFFKPLTVIVGIVCGLLIALQTYIHWQTYLLWANGVEWGRVDPQFDRDLSYFMFDLPFYALINRWAFIGLLVTLVLCAITSYIFGGIRPQAPGSKLPVPVNIHFSLMLMMLMAMLGWRLLIELHMLSYSDRGVITGLGFTDSNASLVAYKFVASGVVTGFVLFQVNIRKPGWILPTIALVWLFLIGLAAARFYPNIYQLLIVEPQELERESSFIEDHLEFTRYGFGLDSVDRRTITGRSPVPGDLEEYRDDFANLRLWDSDTIQINFEEMQALRSYYEFPNIDFDRYVIDGRQTPVLVGAREVNIARLPEGSRRWQTQRMILSHGSGVVAADVTASTAAGMPVFLTYDMPVQGVPELVARNPRIYYGERTTGFAFVDTDTLELDRPLPPNARNEKLTPVVPDDNAANAQANDRRCPEDYIDDPSDPNPIVDALSPAGTGPEASPENTSEECARDRVGFRFNNYSGEGGVVMRNVFHRLSFALRLWDLRLGLTRLLDADNKVLFHRNVRDRIARVAPYLKVDRDPYPVVLDGRIKWIVDCYTVSDMMPYSRRVNLTSLTQVTQPKQDGGLLPDEFLADDAGLAGTANYLRGSVKAVVDAYDGTVTLYVVDPDDRVLQSWKKVFPDSYVPMSEASETLRAHFRYPQDLFRIQATIWSDYHMITPEAYYSREAAWRIPPDTSFISDRAERQTGHEDQRRADMRPYWLQTRFPGDDEEQFAIVQTFSPENRNLLTGYLAGLSDGDRMGELISYALPPTKTVLGPAQAQARIDQDTEISAWITLRMQSGSRVSRGRLITLPLGDTVLYVQPLFVQADKSEVSTLLGAQLASLPELKKVVLVMGDRVLMRDSLQEAVEAILGTSATATTPPPSPDN
ncbi:UPF0182 family protein [Salipiger sp. IMCC34102]|uniref:UPF0182 family protein n=1 Tax=Salipiger sp. IMCC34102 TaxID=2510647 RepID=UPI00101C1A59|nr:UPF0182 family protein [Salipiger sp. IMCC34102]RYH02558.1 UPF0182 family protein [Salipiger sp. IMCC34102]